jgi:hypothetical protein
MMMIIMIEEASILMKEAAITGCLFENIVFENLNLKGTAVLPTGGSDLSEAGGRGPPSRGVARPVRHRLRGTTRTARDPRGDTDRL